MAPDFQQAKRFILDKLANELSKDLVYHSLQHTLDVYEAAKNIAKNENIAQNDIELLEIATLFHDSGFVANYKNHEETSCRIAREVLPKYGFSEVQIAQIEDLIMATKIPQNPKNHLECIICDADLDYLGRDDFYKISQTLFHEMQTYMGLKDENTWNAIQINFFKNHHYHTNYCRQNREIKKQEHLAAIIQSMEA